MAERFSCARSAEERSEPLFATASIVRRWLLVEQPGPWGVDALLESRLPAVAGRALAEKALHLGARVILLRRHGRAEDDGGERTCFVAYTAHDGHWLESFAFERPAELVDLDLDGLRDGRSVGGRPVEDPLYLVCTNGSHDPCCAEFGRPLAAALSAARPDLTWECSHIGGDRFAANLVVFPHGLYFGRVDPEEATAIVDCYDEGRLVLSNYRGRCWYPFSVQAAEHFLRERLGLVGVDDLRFLGRRRTAVNAWRVRFADPAGTERSVVVQVRPTREALQLTCHAEVPHHPPVFRELRPGG